MIRLLFPGRWFFCLTATWLVLCVACSNPVTPPKLVSTNNTSQELRDGDVVFQVSQSGQSAAIQAATGSKYSHCGILFQKNGSLYVLEAVQPVRIIDFKAWIDRGKNGHYVVKRLKNADQLLSEDVIERMKSEGKKYLGRNYDLTFRWSDDRMYCSELVWKIFQRAAKVELTELETFKDFDLSGKLTKKIIKERYGQDLPYEEKAISPGKLFESSLLETVISVN